MSNGGGMLGSGGFFGGGMGPRGPFGAWPGCGCGSGLLMILAGILLVFGGCLRMFNM
jgi:hypothetical protein